MDLFYDHIGMSYNFEKYDNTAVDTQNTPYDYGSVMHYGPTAFSKNGLNTIEPLQSGVVIGQRQTLSEIDIQEVRLFYGCSAAGSTLPPTGVSPTIQTYSTQLTTFSRTFTRPRGSGRYYYVALRFTVSTSGVYTFQSTSAIDTYGCLYSSFNPFTPNENLMLSDDDGAGDQQFKLTVSLRSRQIVILVVTTHTPRTIGAVKITISSASGTSFDIKRISDATTTTKL
ncbi:unnamed protein product [Rotaria sp. Silwood1]|nr:unnamed protein product [Rotaria sp. Silwood1]